MKTRSSILCVLILNTTSALFACNQPSLPAFVERFDLPKFTRGNEVCAFNMPYAPDPDKILRIPTIDTVYPRYPSLLGK